MSEIGQNPEVAKEGQRRLIVPVEQLIPGINTERLPRVENHNDNVDTPIADYASTSLGSVEGPFAKPKLLPYFENQIIVDLGAGRDDNGLQIATALGAKGYVGIERNMPNWLLSSIEHREQTQKISAAVVPEDMLTFLRRLPDQSVGVMAYGINEDVLKNKEYIDKVDIEIMRVLAENSAFLGDNTTVLLQNIKGDEDDDVRLFHLVPGKRE